MSLDKINIDFQILNTLDPRVLLIADVSTWGQIEAKSSIVEVLLPGETTAVVLYYDKGKVNVLNSTNLRLTCTEDCTDVELIDLPDGVYEITVKGSPDTFNKTRKYLRTTLTQLELDKIFIRLNLACGAKDTNILEELTNIEMLLKAAEANTRADNMCEAQELLFLAQEKINKLKSCSTCVG